MQLHQHKRFAAATAAAASLLMVGLVALVAPTTASAGSAAPTSADCEALTSFLGTDEASTTITNASVVEANGASPSYCKVVGTIAPTTGFEVWLPLSTWNAKFVFRGCGGSCGLDPAALNESLRPQLNAGFAIASTDMGRRGSSADFSAARNNRQWEIDFGYRSTHLSTVAAKAIIHGLYGSRPSASYFYGGSTGGRQGLVEAQRYPADYQGIVSIAPAVDETALGTIHLLWSSLSNLDDNGDRILVPDDARLLNQAAVARCDIVGDRLRDGIIGDAAACDFTPDMVLCSKKRTTNCLTAAKVEAAHRIYDGARNSSGGRLGPRGPLPGSELNWINTYISASDAVNSGYYDFGRSFTRDAALENDLPLDWSPEQLDWDTIKPQLAYMEQFYTASNSDLSAFRDLGGKVIMYQGSNDQSVIPAFSENYYLKVRATMGGESATKGFFRFFEVPGMNHVSGGIGADSIDSISALDQWVTQGKAPDVLIGSHVESGVVKFTRPHFPYPYIARYHGGDPNDASSFRPHRTKR